MANPTKITFTLPATYTDGSVFQTVDIADKVKVQFDNGPVVDSTLVVQDTVDPRVFHFPLGPFNLNFGSHTVKVAIVADNGFVSVLSGAATFSLVDERVPNPPTSLRAE